MSENNTPSQPEDSPAKEVESNVLLAFPKNPQEGDTHLITKTISYNFIQAAKTFGWMWTMQSFSGCRFTYLPNN